MKTVNIGELKNNLSRYLQYVKTGEEVVINDRDVPIARILPFRHNSDWSEQERRLVASGAMTMPEEEIDWDEFFKIGPVGNVSTEIAVQVAIDSRGDR